MQSAGAQRSVHRMLARQHGMLLGRIATGLLRGGCCTGHDVRVGQQTGIRCTCQTHPWLQAALNTVALIPMLGPGVCSVRVFCWCVCVRVECHSMRVSLRVVVCPTCIRAWVSTWRSPHEGGPHMLAMCERLCVYCWLKDLGLVGWVVFITCTIQAKVAHAPGCQVVLLFSSSVCCQ